MRIKQEGFLMVACGGMLLSWVYAWAAFVMPMVGFRPFSIMDGAFILALAMTVTLLHQGRGWRIISIIGLQGIGFTCAALRMIYTLFEGSYSFWSMDWLSALMAQQHDLLEWMGIVLLLLWAAVLWMGGIKLARRTPDPLTISSRFDLGVAAFLLLLLIRLLIIAKGAATGHGEHCEMSFIAFFMFGLLTLGMARYGDRAEKGYMATYRGVGVVLGFISFVLLFGGALMILFLPSLMRAANLGHDLLRAAVTPVVPVVIGILRFILVRGCRMAPHRNTATEQDLADPHLHPAAGMEGGLLQYIFTWGAICLGSMIALSILVVAFYYLIRWLASRGVADEKRPGVLELLIHWFSSFKGVILSFLARMTRKTGTRRGAVYLYTRLLHWGGLCGLPHIPMETPLEYGTRLARHFPDLKNEITMIVDLFNRTVYGAIDLTETELATVRLAWYRLRSPLLWPARLKTWFLSPGARSLSEG